MLKEKYYGLINTPEHRNNIARIYSTTEQTVRNWIKSRDENLTRYWALKYMCNAFSVSVVDMLIDKNINPLK